MKAGKWLGGYAGKQKHAGTVFAVMLLVRSPAYPLTILPAYPRIIFR